MPFAALIAAMVCYLSLSRRLELVIARSAGVSAWQFVMPALVIALLIGIFANHGLQSCFRQRCVSSRSALKQELFGGGRS